MEKRNKPRSKALKDGKIIFNNKSSVVDCAIRNLTTKGALLVVASSTGIPDKFDLLVVTEQPVRPSKVAWRQQDRLGVEFR